MRQIRMVLITAILSVQPLLAHAEMSEGNACGVIAKACLKAGYNRMQAGDKQFWQDCMEPIILGKTVSGVTIDATTAKDCRTAKIAELQEELTKLQNAS